MITEKDKHYFETDVTFSSLTMQQIPPSKSELFEIRKYIEMKDIEPRTNENSEHKTKDNEIKEQWKTESQELIKK